MNLGNNKYVTKFRERESNKPLYRSGRFIGYHIIPEGKRPYKEKEVVYEPVKVIVNDERQNLTDSVFDAMD